MSALVRCLLVLLSWLPRRFLQAIGALIGWLHYLADSRAAKVTRANIELCLPDADQQLVRDSLVETGKCLMETPAAWLAPPDRIDGWIRKVHGEAHLQELVSSSQGLLILLPHIGNWELFNVLFRRFGRMTALYQRPRLGYMDDLMADVRARRGNRMVPADRSGVTALFRTLKEGGTVVVLPDQVPATGSFVPFFGHQALTDELSSRLLFRTGANAVGIAMIRGADGLFDAHVLKPSAEIYEGDERATLAVNRLVEQAIELAPAQYQWEYKRFRERPAGEAKIYRFGKPPGLHEDI